MDPINIQRKADDGKQRERERDKDPKNNRVASWRLEFLTRSLEVFKLFLAAWKGHIEPVPQREGMAVPLHRVLLCVGERCKAISGTRLCVDNCAPTAKKMLFIPFHRWGHSGSETVNNSGRIQIYSVKTLSCNVQYLPLYPSPLPHCELIEVKPSPIITVCL